MIYLKNFYLASGRDEKEFLDDFSRTCFDSHYPFELFPRKGLEDVEFSDVTIFCGSNGSGKSTLLNIISEKLQLPRSSMYNKTYFFTPYLESCRYEMFLENPLLVHGVMQKSKTITSDDVFNHIIGVRDCNEEKNFKRSVIFEEKSRIDRGVFEFRQRDIDFNDSESINLYKFDKDIARKSGSQAARRNVGFDERTYSNGENAFKYFTDAIKPGGLYILDEPENSLAADLQIDLCTYILGMARAYDCQFIISSHSPFILSMPYAKIYDMDSTPVQTTKWTDIPSVRSYYEFFRDHMQDFA